MQYKLYMQKTAKYGKKPVLLRFAQYNKRYLMIFLWYSEDQWVLWEVHEGSSFYVSNPVPLQIEDLQRVQSSPHLGSDLR